MDKTDYNAEPVYYCKRCLSLRIFDVPPLKGTEYCDECGSTDIGTCHIEKWEKLYEERYGHSFINNTY